MEKKSCFVIQNEEERAQEHAQFILNYMALGEKRMAEAYAFGGLGRSMIIDSLDGHRMLNTPTLNEHFTAVYIPESVAHYAEVYREKLGLK